MNELSGPLLTVQVDALYAHDLVQASTRVNYASNLAQIHGLDTMVGSQPAAQVIVTKAV